MTSAPVHSFGGASDLYLSDNQLTNVDLPAGMNRLQTLDLGANQLTTLSFPPGLVNLTELILNQNPLTNLSFPPELRNLTVLAFEYSLITNFSFLAGLEKLATLDLGETRATSINLPPQLTSLVGLSVSGNSLTNLSFPAGIEHIGLHLADLRKSGVHVTLDPVLKSAQRYANGDFTCELFADTGTFKVERSADLQTWTEVGAITVTTPNFPGTHFTATNAHGMNKAFYRVKSP